MILPSGLQYTLKRVGPKTDPCGTPYLTRLQQERELFTFTEVVRSTRYDRNHSKALSLTPSIFQYQRSLTITKKTTKKQYTIHNSRILSNQVMFFMCYVFNYIGW